MLTKWHCQDCGVYGRVGRRMTSTPEQVAKWIEADHKQRSPECVAGKSAEAAGMRPRAVLLTQRDRHILLTVRLRRKAFADALRVARKHDAAMTRKQWLVTRIARKGYATT